MIKSITKEPRYRFLVIMTNYLEDCIYEMLKYREFTSRIKRYLMRGYSRTLEVPYDKNRAEVCEKSYFHIREIISSHMLFLGDFKHINLLISFKKYAFLIFVTVFSFLFILGLYLRYPIMYGIDGPFYLVQVRHIVEKGVPKYADPPLTFYMLVPFYILFPDKMLGLKVGTSLYVTLTATLLYLLFSQSSNDNIVGLISSLFFIISPFTIRLYTDFIKNTIGLLFIVLLLYSIYCIRSKRTTIALILFSAIGVTLSHVLDFAVFTLLVALMFLKLLIFKEKYSKELRFRVTVALGVSIALLLACLAIPQIVGYDTRKLFSFLEQPLSEEQHTMTSNIAYTLRNFPLSLFLCSAGIFYSLARSSPLSPIFFASSILIVMLNFPLISKAWLFRFELMNSILIPLVIPIAILAVKSREAKVLILLIILGFATMITVPMIPRLRPSIPLLEYTELELIPAYIPEGSTLIVPNTRLRYWVEALHEDKYEILSKPLKPPVGAYLIIETKMRTPPFPPLFNGKYIKIYLIRLRR